MVVKLAAAAAVALVLGGPVPAHAQTAQQWSQLLAYVAQQSRLIIDLRSRLEVAEQEAEQLRRAYNESVAALDQERCRINRLTGALQDLLKEPPIRPTWVEGVACSDLKSPLPPFPQPVQ
jgi:hypothetical protein